MRRSITIAIITFSLLFSCLMAAYASENDAANEEEKENQLTLEEAVERAQKHAIKVERTEKEVDKAWEERDAARKGYIGTAEKTYIEAKDVYVSVPDAGMDVFHFMSAHGKWEINKKSLEITEDAVALQTKMHYFNILEKQQELETAKAELAKAEDDYRILQARLNAGMATNAEKKGLQSEIESKKSNIQKKKSELEEAYRKLNKLIGFNPVERKELVTSIEYEELDIPSLESKISTLLSPENNPFLWTKKEGYEISKYTWSFSEPSEAGKIDRDIAKLDYEEARIETRNVLRNLAGTLKTIESSYNSAQQRIEAAEEALRVTQKMYEVGMATKNEVSEKELNLQKAKDALLTIKKNYELTKERFEKPWLATAEANNSNGS